MQPELRRGGGKSKVEFAMFVRLRCMYLTMVGYGLWLSVEGDQPAANEGWTCFWVVAGIFSFGAGPNGSENAGMEASWGLGGGSWVNW